MISIRLADRELPLASQHFLVSRPGQSHFDPFLNRRNLSPTEPISTTRHLQIAIVPDGLDQQACFRPARHRCRSP